MTLEKQTEVFSVIVAMSFNQAKKSFALPNKAVTAVHCLKTIKY